MTAGFGEALGHPFGDPALLEAALTHPSALDPRNGPRGFERLEFLGDRVLGLLVAELLVERHPDLDEGALTRRLVALVRREALLEVAQATGLHDVLVRARDGDGRLAGTAAADAVEAVIAALFLDGGLDAARGFVRRHWRDLVERAAEREYDPKTMLQEWGQSRGLDLPRYRVRSRRGPAHRPEFEVCVSLGGGASGTGKGGSKRAAEQNAAAALLARLDTA